MTQSARFSPPNSLILVLDPRSGEAPSTVSNESVVATSSGLAIGTLAEMDGETEVNLGGSDLLPKDGSVTLRWEGTLETTGRLAVLSVYSDVLIAVDAEPLTRIEIWTNDPDEPDLIWVSVT